MHVVRPDIDPIARGISRYQAGPHGVAMSVAFASLGLALLTSALAFAWRRPVPALLTASAVGSLAVALFPLPPDPPLFTGVIHQTGGAAAMAGALAAALLSTRNGVARAGAIAGVLFVISGAFRDTPIGAVTGLLQRVTFAAICLWLWNVPNVPNVPNDPNV